MPSGRYFAAWEELTAPTDRLGRIYTAYTSDIFSGKFSSAFRLDELSPLIQDKCMHPSIACQFNNMNNDMNNLTAVILFERAKEENPADCDILGFYNKEAVYSENWEVLTLTDGSNNEIRPDITFDPGNSLFMVTYCDSTNQKLPYLVQGMNLETPDNWTLISPGYNDGGMLVSPNPVVEINSIEDAAAHVWVSDDLSGNGIAMFDAEYSTVGQTEREAPASFQVTVSPNPCSSWITLRINLDQSRQLEISLFNPMGQKVMILADQEEGPGRVNLNFSLNNIPAGCYFYRASAGGMMKSGRLVVIKQ